MNGIETAGRARSMGWTRRQVLQALAAGAGAASLPFGWRSALGAEPPDVTIRLIAAPDRVALRRGPKTQVLSFSAEVIGGRAGAVRPLTGYLGPTLELRRGEHVRIEFVNRTGDRSIVHWHGMIVPDVADGHPRHAVAPGGSYIYEFIVRNPAGTYLYHPHPHGRTGRQVYAGLAGLLIVRDDDERGVGLPTTEHELGLVLQDRRVGDDNQLLFERSMMDTMNGVFGDTILVNGRPDAAFSVMRRCYRLRIANVSNARIYKLAWSDRHPLRVIGGDSGLFSRAEGAQSRPYVVLAPFQRVELLEDFGDWPSRREMSLISEHFEDPGGMAGMMRGMMGGGMMGGSQGVEMLIARFTVAEGQPTASPPLMLPPPAAPLGIARKGIHTRLTHRHMEGLLNDRAFEMTAVGEDERLPLGEETIWTFSNDSGGMAMPHPMHIHGVRFRVVKRSGGAPADLRDGLVDAGYRDTVLVFPGEEVRVAVAPTEPGLFMYHCHNLEHEDGGMMRNCWFGPDPVKAV